MTAVARVLGCGEGTATAINDAGTVVGSRPARGQQDYVVESLSDDGLVSAGHSVGENAENQPLMWRCR